MCKQSIIVSARVEFTAIHQIPRRMQGIDIPIELTLPYKYDDWKGVVKNFDRMLTTLEDSHVTINTVHATHGKISDKSIFEWGQQTIRVAEHFGAQTITVHPNCVRKQRGDMQVLARSYLRQLQRHTSVVISVETFTSNDRIFSPEEIIAYKLPMTLDTAHIYEHERIMRIIDNYWGNIHVVHLSARGEEGPHLPIDSFCIQVVRKLVNLKWSGTITLEYLPWHHYRLKSDIEIVKQALIGDVKPNEIPPPCNAYKECQDKWGHDTPEPNTTNGFESLES